MPAEPLPAGSGLLRMRAASGRRAPSGSGESRSGGRCAVGSPESVVATTAVAIATRAEARRRRRGPAAGAAGSRRAAHAGARAAESGRSGAGTRPRPGRRARRRTRARGAGRSSRSAAASSVSSLKGFIACLPQLAHRSVQPGAGVRLGDPEHDRDLGVGEAGEELERDQLALAPRRSPSSAAPRARRRSLRSTPSATAAASASTGSTASSAWRLRRRSSSRAALRAIPNSQARGSPRRGSKRARLR